MQTSSLLSACMSRVYTYGYIRMRLGPYAPLLKISHRIFHDLKSGEGWGHFRVRNITTPKFSICAFQITRSLNALWLHTDRWWQLSLRCGADVASSGLQAYPLYAGDLLVYIRARASACVRRTRIIPDKLLLIQYVCVVRFYYVRDINSFGAYVVSKLRFDAIFSYNKELGV